MSKFLATGGFNWMDPKDFDLNKYAGDISKSCVLEVDLEILMNYVNHFMIIL